MWKDVVVIIDQVARGVVTLSGVSSETFFSLELARIVGLRAQSVLRTRDVTVFDWSVAYRVRRRNVMEVASPDFYVALVAESSSGVSEVLDSG
jgi:hypothetical protein